MRQKNNIFLFAIMVAFAFFIFSKPSFAKEISFHLDDGYGTEGDATRIDESNIYVYNNPYLWPSTITGAVPFENCSIQIQVNSTNGLVDLPVKIDQQKEEFSCEIDWTIMLSQSVQVYYVNVTNNETDETELYYIINSYNSPANRSGGYLFTEEAELLNNNKVKNDDASIQYSNNGSLFKQYTTSDTDMGIVYIRFTRPHKALTIYSMDTAADWMKPDNNYVRLNGSESRQFDAANVAEENITSAPLKLKKGWNVIEAYSPVGNPNFHSNNGNGDFSVSNNEVDTFVWLINYTGNESVIQTNNNTKIDNIRAVNYVGKLKETFGDYKVNIDSENDVYSIDVPEILKYPFILLQVRAADAGATVKMPENMVCSSYGSIYSLAVTEETNEIPVTIIASDGTQKIQTIKLNRLPSEAFIENIEITNGSLSKEFDKEENAYVIDMDKDIESIKFNISIPNGSSVTFNDEEGAYSDNRYSYDTSAKKDKTDIVITAADGITKQKYTFVNRDSDGNMSYFGVSEETKNKAKELLQSYYNRENKDAVGSFWGVFGIAATEDSFEGKYVYDITKHNYNQATDYAGVILELVMIGENPYNFGGVNYVELLEKESENYGGYNFGPYGNNIWAYIAFKAAGYNFKNMDSLFITVKNQAFDDSFSLELRSWALAAIADELSVEERIAMIEQITDASLWKTGDDAGLFVAEEYQNNINSNCHACVLTGLNALGIDVEKFAIDEEHSPLCTMKTRFLTEDGLWKYNQKNSYPPDFNKDVIVALGEISTGKSIYNKYQPDTNDLTTLISTAESLLTSGTEEQQKKLHDAYNVAKEIEDITKNGKAYYDLLEAAKAIKKDLVPSVRMCSIDTGKTIDKLIEDINGIGEVTQENALSVMELQKAYDTLENDIVKGYVTNYDVLSEAVADAQELIKQNTIDLITQLPDTITLNDEVTVNEAKKAYDALTDEMKQNIPQELVTKLTNALKVIESLKKGTDQATSTVPTNSTQATSNETNETKAALNLKSTSSANKVKLSWSPVEGANGYEIFRYNTKTKKYKSIALVSSKKSSYIISRLNGKKGSKLQPATKYTFKVSAYTNSDGKKVYTLAEVLKTATCPSKVTKVKVKKSLTKATVTWSRVKGSTGYQVWGKTSKAGKYKLLKTVKGSKTVRCTVKGLQKNKNYYIKVRAYKTVGSKNVYGTCSAVVKTK